MEEEKEGKDDVAAAEKAADALKKASGKEAKQDEEPEDESEKQARIIEAARMKAVSRRRQREAERKRIDALQAKRADVPAPRSHGKIVADFTPKARNMPARERWDDEETEEEKMKKEAPIDPVSERNTTWLKERAGITAFRFLRHGTQWRH